jgi:3-dehydroquinate dehydratase/shikimate dehydrogenase
MTYLKIPIAAKNPEQAKIQIEAALTAGAEMLELRTDYLENLDVDLIKRLISEVKSAAQKPVPIIVTCRDVREGGAINYPLKLRMDVLIAAIKAGAEYIDFEYENFLAPENRGRIGVALSQSLKGKLILSTHNFAAKFENIGALRRRITTLYPVAIPKIVYTANHINDCFDALDLLHKTSGERIAFCMGQAGLISRIIVKKLDGFVTFASIDSETATAPGQLAVEQLKKLYRYDSINADTELYGVIGSPIAHSLSPAIHNACFADIDANKLYLPLLVEGGAAEFNEFMRNVLNRPWLGFKGFSVTIPHKENALNYVVQKEGVVEPLAKRIGAVNTLIIESRATSDERRIQAYNTDYAGAMDAILAGMDITRGDLRNVSAAVIGAGGVARAVVAGLSDAHAKITIYNRTVKRGEALAADFDCDFATLDELSRVEAELLINCTSIGMHPNINETPILKEYLKPEMTVFDTIYNPAETLLLKHAKGLGCKTISGMDMFLNQALLQFKLFTGTDANPELVRKVLRG